MNKRSDHRIGVPSAVLVFLNLSLAKFLLIVPSFIVQEVGNSAWIVILLNGALSIGVFALIAVLYKPYVALGLGGMNMCSVGKFLGGAVNLVLVGIIITRGALLFRILVDALRTLEASDSSQEFMALFILVPVLVCVMKGFNVNVGISAIIIPFTIISVAIISAILMPHFRYDNLMPVLGEGPDKILFTLVKFGGFSELAFALTFSRYLSGYKTMRRSGFIGIGAITLITAVFTLMYCAAIPYPASKGFVFPLYQLSRLFMAGSFMQHLEPLVVFIWAGIVLCALATVVLAAGELLATSAGVKDGSGFAPLLVMSIFLGGMIPRSELSTYDAYRMVLKFSNYAYIVIIFIVVLIARGRKIENKIETV
ncbi:MAG: GerAB/ArcD/ProY family transporter [Oscillospiraceae bacterium]|nr:GerAB/ArcD/ProY family transporter [Oscillospiraceae bacterium]